VVYFVFSGCVFLTFRHSCIAESRMRLDNELTLVMTAVEGAPHRLASIETEFPGSNFRVVTDRRPLYASAGWQLVAGFRPLRT